MISLRYYKNKQIFFKTLYKSQNSQDNVPESHLFNVENIDPLQILCEGMISEEECLTALKEFKNNKTPGTDGFSAEFYKFFWSDLGTVMTASFNYAFQKGSLSIRRGALGYIRNRKTEEKKIIKNR